MEHLLVSWAHVLPLSRTSAMLSCWRGPNLAWSSLMICDTDTGLQGADWRHTCMLDRRKTAWIRFQIFVRTLMMSPIVSGLLLQNHLVISGQSQMILNRFSFLRNREKKKIHFKYAFLKCPPANCSSSFVYLYS